MPFTTNVFSLSKLITFNIIKNCLAIVKPSAEINSLHAPSKQIRFDYSPTLDSTCNILYIYFLRPGVNEMMDNSISM